MAQLVAHPTCNRKVRGSSPLAGSLEPSANIKASDVDDDDEFNLQINKQKVPKWKKKTKSQDVRLTIKKDGTAGAHQSVWAFSF